MRRLTAIAALLVVVPLLVVGCGDDGGEEVDVVLAEFSVEPDPASVEAGDVTFAADNQGAEVHEFVVARATSADELPVDEDGAVDEAALGEENLPGEIEDIASQDQQELDVALEAGDYVLFCNVVEEEESGALESHFAEGMNASFTVE